VAFRYHFTRISLPNIFGKMRKSEDNSQPSTHFMAALELFNASKKPRRAMRRIIQRGFLKVPQMTLNHFQLIQPTVQGESEEIARFLHDGNSSLDKVKLGMLLSEKYALAPALTSLGLNAFHC